MELGIDEFHDGVDFFLRDVFSLLGSLLHCLLVLFGDDDRGGLLRPGAHVDDDQCDDGDGRDDGDSVGLHGTNLQLPSIFFYAPRHDLNIDVYQGKMKVFIGFIVLLSCIMVVAGSGAYSFASIQELPPVDPVRDKLGRVLPVLKEPESGDCQGTVYKKRGQCKNTSGDILDGSEGKCGKGKVSWALDVKDPGYKPEFGPLGKCPNFEELRDCEVPCPKPCEGDTWKKGECVRKDANGKVTVLDGTKGKCGDGILDLTLDTTAADYKPAVGSGTCITKKEGACFVKCPKPEPPKCSYVTAGWQKNDLGCVTSKTPAADGSYTTVSCGQSGWRQEYKASTLNTEKCDTLTRWLPCKAPPCPIDCVGSWSDWSACTLPAGEVCGITKTKSTYRVTREKNSTGKACPNGWYDGQEREKTCGQSQSVSCCTKGNWENVGEPLSTGKQKQKRTVVGCDPETTPKVREIDACYKSEWIDQGCVGTDGKKKQKRTVKGARCDFNTKNEQLVEDLAKCCKQSLNWTPVGKCGEENDKRGKQKYTQDISGVCASGTDTEYRDCAEDCKGKWAGNSGEVRFGLSSNYTRWKTLVYDATLNEPYSAGGKPCEYKHGQRVSLIGRGRYPRVLYWAHSPRDKGIAANQCLQFIGKQGDSYGKDALGAWMLASSKTLKDFNNGVKSYHKMPKVGNWTYYCAVHR